MIHAEMCVPSFIFVLSKDKLFTTRERVTMIWQLEKKLMNGKMIGVLRMIKDGNINVTKMASVTDVLGSI